MLFRSEEQLHPKKEQELWQREGEHEQCQEYDEIFVQLYLLILVNQYSLISLTLFISDVWGSSSVSSTGGSRYFVVFVDDYSRYSWIFNVKYRSELLQVYSNFAKMVETQFSKRIKIFQSNNALEYTQYDFQADLHSYSTVN